MTTPELTSLSDPTNVLFELIEERPGFTEDGAYAFLAGADTSVFGLPKIVVAAAEVQTGAMIALVPSDADAKRLRFRNGEPVGQLHATLVYLGEADAISNDARRALIDRLRALVVDAPLDVFDAEGFGVSVFNPPGHVKEDGRQRDTCLVLQLGGAEIDRVHTLVTNAMRRIDGLRPPEQHRPWVPHVTLVYTDDFAEALAEAALRTGPVTFDRLRVAFAGDVHDVELRPLTAAFWRERDHPRDDEGQFTEKDLSDRFAAAKRGVAAVRAAIPASSSPGSQTLSSAEKSATSLYETGAFRWINSGLRRSRGRASRVTGAPDAHATRFDSTPAVRGAIERLDAIHARSRTTDAIVVSRGVADPREIFGKRWPDADLTGFEWVEYGYSSTSPDPQNALRYATQDGASGALLDVLVPEGTGAVHLDTHDDYGSRHEVVLERGARFRVVADRGWHAGARRLDVVKL